MQCPYCTTEISEAAIVCPSCTRDLYLFGPLLRKISALEAQLAESPAVERLASRLDELEERIDSINHAQPGAPSWGGGSVWVQLWLLPLLLLLLSHFLITMVYDLNTLYLRLVSLLVPLPFAFLLMQERRNFWTWVTAAFVLGGIAALGMSTITSSIDQTPILPHNLRDWREFIEYSASIGLSYVSGMVLGSMRRQRREASERNAGTVTLKLAKLFSKGTESAEKLQSIIHRLRDFSNSLTLAATSGVAAYAGLKGFIGN